MRAIAGCLSLTGEPLGPEHRHDVARPAPGGGGELRVWDGGEVALGYVPGATVALGDAEGRPAVDPRSGCAAVLCGVVHDWGATGGDAPRPGIPDDAEGLLGLYAAGGVAALERMTGDFAAALWDPRERRLRLWRDPMGGVNLLYARGPERLRFATTAEQLLAGSEPIEEIDEEAVVWLLYGYTGVPADTTFFAAIRRLSGGQMLEASGRSVAVRRYHHWPEEPPAERPVTGDDVERFRELFLEAVRCRLPPPGQGGVLISGGVDSSAVACAAAVVAGGDAPALYTASFERRPAMDERRYSSAVAEQHGLRLVAEPADDAYTFSDLERWLPACAEPFFAPFDAVTEPAIAHARADGVRALLWGHAGDTVVTGTTRRLAALLLRGHWRELAREGRAEAADSPSPAWRTLASSVVLPLLPVGVQSYALRRHDPWSSAWAPPRLAARVREAMRPDFSRGPDAWWHETRRLFDSSTGSPASGYLDRRARFEGVEYRAPFLDRRIAEAVLTLPGGAMRRDGLSKAILRDALGADLPPVVARRRDKVVLTDLMDEGLRRDRAGLLRELAVDSELARRDWVREGPWRDALHRYLAGDDRPRAPLWGSLLLELWLRRRAGRGPV